MSTSSSTPSSRSRPTRASSSRNGRSFTPSVASAIETLFSERIEEFYSVLAYHYAKAEDWNKAQDYLFKAGDQAGRIAADAEALSHYEQALETYARVFGDKWDPVQRAALERKMGEAFYRRGEHEKAMEYFRHALAQLGRPLPEGTRGVRLAIVREIAVQLGHRLIPGLFVKKGDGPVSPLAEEEAHVYETLCWIVGPGGDPEMFLLASLRLLNLSERNALHLGTVIGFVGLQSRGRLFGPVQNRGLLRPQVPRRGGDRRGATQHWATLTSALRYTSSCFGRLTMTLDSARRSAEAFRTSGYWNLHGWAMPAVLVGLAHYYLGNFAEASIGAQELIRFGEDANDHQVRYWGLNLLGWSQYGMGRLHEAVSTLREAAELAKTVPDLATHGGARAYLGKCYVRLGNLPMAFTTLRDTEAFLRSHGAAGMIERYSSHCAGRGSSRRYGAKYRIRKIKVDERRTTRLRKGLEGRQGLRPLLCSGGHAPPRGIRVARSKTLCGSEMVDEELKPCERDGYALSIRHDLPGNGQTAQRLRTPETRRSDLRGDRGGIRPRGDGETLATIG